MTHPDDPRGATTPDADAKLLARLGFGPETVLMNDPKLFVDRPFLAALLAEFAGELGAELAASALFQIGLMHGFRDAKRFLDDGPETTAHPREASTRSTSLALELGPAEPGMRITGQWPELHEAEARLQRLGLAATPACHLSAGYTSGWLSGTMERDLVAIEIECTASGGESCRFEVREPADWLDDPRSEHLRGVDLRTGLTPFRPIPLVSSHERGPIEMPHFDGQDQAVHIWGPVMILPFTDPDEVLATLEMLSRDPQTRTTRAVVIDLTHVVLDEGFMAAALEQTLDTIEAWGAEAIMAGASSLNQTIIADFERDRLVTLKDLPEAIASAFQITDAQRHDL